MIFYVEAHQGSGAGYREVNGLGKTLYIVVPCYNEADVLHDTARQLEDKIKHLVSNGIVSNAGKVVFIDDGSHDKTWDIIESLCAQNNMYAGVKLSRNSGHQNALLAGLMSVKGEVDIVISIDADLQDDVNAIDKMVDEYYNGCDIVYGVRGDRQSDGFFKRTTAQGYYKLLRLFGCDIVYNHADYRLMSAKALQALSEYSEQRIFLRGLMPMLGFKTAIIQYSRGLREAGESKYPLKRMLRLAFDGLFSLSLKPLRMVFVVGALMLITAFLILLYAVVNLNTGQQTFSLRLIMFSIWAVGGILTLSLGIIGEYVGRTYIESKRRPRYDIERTQGLRNC